MPRIAFFQHIRGPSEMVSSRLYDKFLWEEKASLITAFVLEVPEVSPLSAFCLKKWRTVWGERVRAENKTRVRITGNLNLDRLQGCICEDAEHMCFPSKPFPVSPVASSGKADVMFVDSSVHFLRLSLFHVDLEQRKINETNGSGRQSGGSWGRTEPHRLSDTIQEAPKFTQPGILKKKIG